MTTKYEVMPLYSDPYYTYSFSLNKIAYNFVFRYSTREACWYMDILTADNVPLIVSVKLVPNFPMLEGLIVDSLDGVFYLIPLVESNLYKFETDPENISEYFQLVYVYET